MLLKGKESLPALMSCAMRLSHSQGGAVRATMKRSLVVETDYTTCWTNYPGGFAIVTGLR